MPRKDIKKPIRKKPTQRRSEETVDAILEAATRVFASAGLDATTTKIAEIAGVSVGSFYQYFPDKHSLLLELRERRYALLFTQFRKINEEMADEPFERALDRILRFIFDHVTAQRDLQRLLMKELSLVPRNDWSMIINKNIQTGLRELFILHRDELHSIDLELSIFVVSASIRGAARALVRDDPKFTNKSLADELTRMITGHLVVVR
ncbi:MAG TPA: TetR/AcrR family transcriptional regulator [Opitutaceae bacterium]|nr:TetR/AcrR family transcriptional regulator [Opitutaceae bacterium]